MTLEKLSELIDQGKVGGVAEARLRRQLNFPDRFAKYFEGGSTEQLRNQDEKPKVEKRKTTVRKKRIWGRI